MWVGLSTRNGWVRDVLDSRHGPNMSGRGWGCGMSMRQDADWGGADSRTVKGQDRSGMGGLVELIGHYGVARLGMVRLVDQKVVEVGKRGGRSSSSGKGKNAW